MDLPSYLSATFPIVFSTNRKSGGDNFDFINFIVQYYYDNSNKEFHFYTIDDSYWYFDSVFVKTNTEFNEFGPLTVSLNNSVVFFLYSSDQLGDLDIFYSWSDPYTPWQNPRRLTPVNSNYNEAYQCFNGKGTELYFCSDSTGNYDIYKIEISTSVSNWIISTEKSTWISQSELNSIAEDKCPYINGNLMVFTSNREGGFGGYDLYYSEFKDKKWTTPVNFGSEINTEFDEYRPVTAYVPNYKNDLMIFSSNRPGGKGGFDLHYVGIPKMID
jgi:hypothetical protein